MTLTQMDVLTLEGSVVPQAEAYAVQKMDRRWGLLCNGEPVMSYGRPSTWTRKRDALEAIPRLAAREEYEARTLAEDETGHVWTADERTQIAAYADTLRINAVKRSLWGDTTPQAAGRHEHFREMNTLESHYYCAYGPGHPNHQPGYVDPTNRWSRVVCAEIRRTRAARAEAFRLAGAALDQNYYSLAVQRTNHPTKICEAHVFTYASLEEAQRALEDIQARGSEHGEIYTHHIDTVSPHWPHVCRWAELSPENGQPQEPHGASE